MKGLKSRIKAFVALLACVAGNAAFSHGHVPHCAQDDLGQQVCVSAHGQPLRVVSLAPHATELVSFVAGVDRLVAVDSASDYPLAVQQLPSVGDSQRIDIESIVSAQPHLVVAWGSGSSTTSLARLRDLGIPVYVSEPRKLADVAHNMRALGKLLGVSKKADLLASEWLEGFNALRQAYSNKKPVATFYQVWGQPLMTFGGAHIVSELLDLCGARNVFLEIDALAPRVNFEAVLQANPELVLTSGAKEGALKRLGHWHKWPVLAAVRNNQLKVLPPDLLVRAGPRLLEGTEGLCRVVEQARHPKTPEYRLHDSKGASLRVNHFLPRNSS